MVLFISTANDWFSQYIDEGDPIVAKDKKTVERPELEAVLRTEGKEIAVVAFFRDAYGGYDVLVGLADFNSRLLVSTAFRNCAEACAEATVVIVSPDETNPPSPFAQ